MCQENGRQEFKKMRFQMIANSYAGHLDKVPRWPEKTELINSLLI